MSQTLVKTGAVATINIEQILALRNKLTHAPIQERLKLIDFFVEATRTEMNMLYDKHKNDGWEWWRSGGGGLTVIGRIGKHSKNRCVNIEWNFAIINGKALCFYYPGGRFVDWTMIEQYIEKNHPGRPHCDANNFYQCLQFCKKY